MKNLAFTSQDTNYTKLGKVAAGLGVAGLAFLSWKFIFAGALGYSSYKGTEYLKSKFWQRTLARGNPVPVSEEPVPQEPVHQADDAHSDQQEKREDPVPHLRQMQQGANLHGKRALELIITHPKIQEKGADFQWVRKLILKHGKWSKWTFGLSSPAVQVFRKLKGSFPEKKDQESPTEIASQ